MLRHDGIVDATPAEQAAMYLRMEGLDASVHDLGKTGHVADVGDRQARVAQRARRAAGGQQADAQGIQATREIEQAGLVGNADQCAAYRH